MANVERWEVVGCFDSVLYERVRQGCCYKFKQKQIPTTHQIKNRTHNTEGVLSAVRE